MANDFTVDLAAANGKVDYAILTKKEDTFPYTDGKRTSDTPIGTKLTLALQGSRLSSLTVKFDHDPLPSVDDAQIKAARANFFSLASLIARSSSIPVAAAVLP